MTTQWLDGRIVDARDPAVVALGRASHSSALSCYTTARVTAGRALHADQHTRRLQRDARAIGLGEIDPALVVRAWADLGRATFGEGTGIVRIEARRGSAEAALSLYASTRPVGLEKNAWAAVTAPIAHHGPTAFPGAKLVHCKIYEEARAISRQADVEECLLFDRDEKLVEGARSNLLIADSRGRLATPDLALGAVAGIALEILSKRVPELTLATIRTSDLAAAREIIAVNAVRGARAITRLDGAAVGAGEPGPWQARLDALLSGSSTGC